MKYFIIIFLSIFLLSCNPPEQPPYRITITDEQGCVLFDASGKDIFLETNIKTKRVAGQAHSFISAKVYRIIDGWRICLAEIEGPNLLIQKIAIVELEE